MDQSTRYAKTSSNNNIIKSKDSDIDFVEDKSFPAFLFDKFDTFGNKPAMVCNYILLEIIGRPNVK